MDSYVISTRLVRTFFRFPEGYILTISISPCRDELNIQSQIDFLELSLPFEFDHPVHPETLKQLDKLWSTITSEDREYAMGSYINFLTRVLSTVKMRSHFANPAWVGLLLRIVGVDVVQCK